MRRPIYHFDELTSFDKWSIGLYLILTGGLSYYFLSIDNFESRRTIIFGYAVLSQLLLYLIWYRSLRNLTVFFMWITIGLFHLFVYYQFKDDRFLEMARGHSTSPLRNTLSLLVVHQVLRLTSFKIQGQELVGPSKGSPTDLFDERKVNWVDYTLFVIYCFCLFGLDFWIAA